MNIRSYKKEDYNTLVNWYNKWNLPITPEDYIPQYALIVEKDVPLCSGFLYQLGDTSMYWIEGIISNPDSKKEDKIEGLKLLINSLVNIAKENKASLILSSTPREGLKNIFNENDFGTTPEQYYHLGRRL